MNPELELRPELKEIYDSLVFPPDLDFSTIPPQMLLTQILDALFSVFPGDDNRIYLPEQSKPSYSSFKESLVSAIIIYEQILGAPRLPENLKKIEDIT